MRTVHWHCSKLQPCFVFSLYNGIYLELSNCPTMPKIAWSGEKNNYLSNKSNQTNNGSALTRKCAYYISLMWDQGLGSFSRQQKEVVVGLALSLLVHLMSQVTVKTSSHKKNVYHPQGGQYFFGGKSSSGVSNITEPGTMTQPSRSKPTIRANGSPLTQSEQRTLQALLQKQRAAQELALAVPPA